MKEKFNKIIAWIKANKKKSIALALVVLLILWSVLREGAVDYEDVLAVRGTVVQEVSVTGKTRAVGEVDLAFERGGTVAGIGAEVGSTVSKGQTIVRLNQGELLADLNSARATLSQEEIKLAEIRKTSPSARKDAMEGLVASLRDAYAKVDDAVRNNIDQFFKNKGTASMNIEFAFIDGNTVYTFPINSDLRLDINTKRAELESKLTFWHNSLLSLDSKTDFDGDIRTAKDTIAEAQVLLNRVATAANSLVATEFQYEATVSGYKDTVATARSSTNTALTNLLTAESKFENAPTQVTTSQGVGLDEVLSQEARVGQYRAQVASAEARLAETVISSPIAGILTKQDARIGEAVTAGTILVSVIQDAGFEIEANVSEVSVGKVALGNAVLVSFDAFPGEEFAGELFYIEPSETIVDGVVNYKIKVMLRNEIPGLKSGLTTNLKVKTAEKPDVLKVPQFAIITENGLSYVEKVVGDNLERSEVVVGLRGSDGTVEIISGISEGDTVRFSKSK
jgi:RND family efflux transporter MFP subunit